MNEEPIAQVVKLEWYLMDCSLPDLNWARLRVFLDGTSDVLDMDGTSKRFACEADAHDWLCEDEFRRLATMDAEDVADHPFGVEDIVAPRADTDDELVQSMYMRWRGDGWEQRASRKGTWR